MFAAEGVRELRFLDGGAPGLDRGLQVAANRLSRREPLLEDRNVAFLAIDPLNELQLALEFFPFALNFLGAPLIVPEAGLGDLPVDLREGRLQFRFVKDSRGRPQPSL